MQMKYLGLYAERSLDRAKKTVGRTRHISVDTDGRLLMVNLTLAGLSDSARAQLILEAIRKRRPWLKRFFADSAYDPGQLTDKAANLDFIVEIIKRIEANPASRFCHGDGSSNELSDG